MIVPVDYIKIQITMTLISKYSLYSTNFDMLLNVLESTFTAEIIIKSIATNISYIDTLITEINILSCFSIILR